MAMSWLFKGGFWLLGTFSAIQMPLSFEIDLQMRLSSSLNKITIIYKASIILDYSIPELSSLSLWKLSNLITHLEWKVKIILIKGLRSLNMIWLSG